MLGTVQNAGTEIMTVSDLNEMEARVDIGEMDVVLIKPGQKARLEVDAFKDRKFDGTVTDIANSAEGQRVIEPAPVPQQQRAGSHANSRCASASRKRNYFVPGMSVTAEIETRSRTNVIAVPIAA